jgi:hypothetical protein
MNFTFGGIGVAIMIYRTTTEKELEKVDGLQLQIDSQREVVVGMLGELSKSVHSADLHKNSVGEFSRHLSIAKSVLDRIPGEIAKFKGLQDQCREALDKAAEAMPDFSMFATEGRSDVVPGRVVFSAEKGGKATPLVMLGTKQPSVDPRATLSDVALSRRFSK